MKTNNKNVVRLTETKLKQIVAESVKRVLMEETYSAEEMRDKWKKDGNLYNDAYPTSNGDDLYTLGSYNNKVEPIYFSNKADAMDWIKTYVTDPKSVQALKDALSQYRLHDPNSDSLGKRRINQVSSNLDTHRRRQSF